MRISTRGCWLQGVLWAGLVCQVLAVPPPAVRPSVKHDAQQRSEDDLSHIIVNMINDFPDSFFNLLNLSPPDFLDFISLYNNVIIHINPILIHVGLTLSHLNHFPFLS